MAADQQTPPAASPSSWRAWIEIDMLDGLKTLNLSPSSWRAWIEIPFQDKTDTYGPSPSSWRAWIEISCMEKPRVLQYVALLVEGVDRNKKKVLRQIFRNMSPSSWRAWIEILKSRWDNR